MGDSKALPVKDRSEIQIMRELFTGVSTLRKLHKQKLARAELSTSEFDVIATLGNMPGMRMSDLAARVITAPSNMTRVCKKLEARGLIERHRSEESDREVIARLTPAGQQLFDDLFFDVVDHFTDLIDSGLSATEQQRLLRLLRKLNARLLDAAGG